MLQGKELEETTAQTHRPVFSTTTTDTSSPAISSEDYFSKINASEHNEAGKAKGKEAAAVVSTTTGSASETDTSHLNSSGGGSGNGKFNFDSMEEKIARAMRLST